MYEISQLFFYRPMFMLELLIAELLFIVGLRFEKGAWWKTLIGCAVCFLIAFAIPVVAFTSLYASVMFAGMFLVTVVMWKFVLHEPLKKIIFATIAGYTVQHIAHEFYELIIVVLGFNESAIGGLYGSENMIFNDPSALTYLIYFQIYLCVYFLFYTLLHNKMPRSEVKINGLTMSVCIVFIVLIDIVFGSIVIYSLPEDIDALSLSLLHIYNISCCVVALILLFELSRRGKAEHDLSVVEQLRHREKEQYRISKENIDLINIKCHDLKHYIRNISHNQRIDRAELNELENLVEIYDSAYMTENVALNVVLSEKSLICKRLKIKLSCIVDAVQLSFMSETDVYTLFGNIFDNAIEAVCHLKESERSIGFSVKSVGEFVVVNIYNGYAGELKFNESLPVTTKRDKTHHGYGLKSIRYVVEKYGGEMRIKTKDQIFDLNLLFIPKIQSK